MSIILNSSRTTRKDIYNIINIYYGYDYSTGDYQYIYTYPESDTLNHSYQIYGKKNSINISMPFIYDQSVAKDWAQKYYQMWAHGLIVGSCSQDITAYNNLIFTPYVGSSGTSHTYIITKLYLNWGDKANLYCEGFAAETDNEDLWSY